MLTDITLGQYFPGDSLLHRMDARVKIILLFFYIVGIFLFDNNICYGLNTALAVLLVFLSGVSPRMVLKSIKPLWWILILTFVIQLFTMPGEVLAKLWIFNITYEGLIKGFLISLRLVLLIGVSSLLMLTTSPLMLTDALESLFRPLKRFGFPAHELAMMMTIALRFIPTLLEETDRIMKAQTARGANFTSGSLIQRGKSMIPLLVPLFVSAFRRADDLATAMEARCYRGGEGRTRMNELSCTYRDAIAMAAVLIVTAILAAMRWL